MNCTYTETQKATYPRTSWLCSCGYQMAIMQGYNPDYNHNDYGKKIIPSGVCQKCKKKIKVK